MTTSKLKIASVEEALRLAIEALNSARNFDTGILNPETGKTLSSYELIPQLNKFLSK